jgi:hypothetical protein
MVEGMGLLIVASLLVVATQHVDLFFREDEERKKLFAETCVEIFPIPLPVNDPAHDSYRHDIKRNCEESAKYEVDDPNQTHLHEYNVCLEKRIGSACIQNLMSIDKKHLMHNVKIAAAVR